MDDFDPREASLTHAGMAERLGQPGMLAAPAISEIVHALACGLVYVGDQIREATERPSALQVVLPTSEAVLAWRAWDEPDEVGRDESGEFARRVVDTLLPVEAVLTRTGDGTAWFHVAGRTFEVRVGEKFTLHVDVSGGVVADLVDPESEVDDGGTGD